MSYYDFDYFWTHQEVGGRKLKELEKKRESFTIRNILKLAFGENNVDDQNQAVSSKKADDFLEGGNRKS